MKDHLVPASKVYKNLSCKHGCLYKYDFKKVSKMSILSSINADCGYELEISYVSILYPDASSDNSYLITNFKQTDDYYLVLSTLVNF